VIERKLAERGEPVSEKEKSSTWKIAVFFYTLAIPFAFTSLLLFFLYLEKDLLDMI